MNLQERKEALVQLGNALRDGGEELQSAKQRAYAANQWFTEEFIDLALQNIIPSYLSPSALDKLLSKYDIQEPGQRKKVGVVMAGNIPFVGIHDLIAVFLSGHIAVVKPSSKDEVLMNHLIQSLHRIDPRSQEFIVVQVLLKNCDAYIATGSNNSSRYFDYYFRNVPSIIRKNRTSVAVLDGEETPEELERLADDVHSYFGLGCRNVTQIFVPEGYDFIPLIEAFKKYEYLIDHNKYKNNYDYNLAVHMINHRYYMSSGALLLVDDPSPFSPISQLNYQFYKSENSVRLQLLNNENIQCVVGRNAIPFGGAQCPSLTDFADGIDTFLFLKEIENEGSKELRRHG